MDLIQNTNFFKGKSFSNKIYNSLPVRVLNFLKDLSRNNQKQIWLVKNNFCHPINYCKTCGKVLKPKFLNLSLGFRFNSYCGPSCQMKDPISHEKLKATYKKRTGYEHPTLNPDSWDLKEKNYLEKTGYKNHMQNPEVIQLREDRCLIKRGITTHLKDPIIIDVIQEKLNHQREEINQKSIATCQLRYGVDHPSQVPEFFEKNKAYSWKDLILPSGEIARYQGYENIAILKLLETYLEEELILSARSMPEKFYQIYKELTGKIHYPDIFLPNENKFIEVKSIYTYNCDTEKVLAKQNACKELGYLYEIWICSDKEVLEIMQ